MPLRFQVFAQNFEAQYLKIISEWHPDNSLDPSAPVTILSYYDPPNSFHFMQNCDLLLGWPLCGAKKRKSFNGINQLTFQKWSKWGTINVNAAVKTDIQRHINSLNKKLKNHEKMRNFKAT